MRDIDRVLAELERLDAAATAGPWSLWRGPQFVGGGEDICIGAGETWLANMDHRATYNPRDHLGENFLGNLPGWQQIAETDIATIDSGEITREQEANATAIASMRSALPLLIPLLRAAQHTLTSLDLEYGPWIVDQNFADLRAALAAFSTLIPEDESR